MQPQSGKRVILTEARHA